ncbi:unnamed protein product [Cyclocybe aegerita]|uniref:Uncharacterized protein n=1 Tax=Cyclocybe aegerita TaxID=1973307 RepID=A0A8S0VUX7_CYCAE|nr:unnamed protein product [Cyclocybe aegerita]
MPDSEDKVFDKLLTEWEEWDRVIQLETLIHNWASQWGGIYSWTVQLELAFEAVYAEGERVLETWSLQVWEHADAGRDLLAKMDKLDGALPTNPDAVRFLWRKFRELHHALDFQCTAARGPAKALSPQRIIFPPFLPCTLTINAETSMSVIEVLLEQEIKKKVRLTLKEEEDEDLTCGDPLCHATQCLVNGPKFDILIYIKEGDPLCWRGNMMEGDNGTEGFYFLSDTHLTHLADIPSKEYFVYDPVSSAWITASIDGLEAFNTMGFLIYRWKDIHSDECDGIVDYIRQLHETLENTEYEGEDLQREGQDFDDVSSQYSSLSEVANTLVTRD